MGNPFFEEMTAEQMRENAEGYLVSTAESGGIAFIEGLCFAMGIDSMTLRKLAKEDSEKGAVARYVLQTALTGLEDAMFDGKVNPAIYIFLMKQFAGYTDEGAYEKCVLPSNVSENE